MESIPFCQRNIRLWIGLLAGCAVLVLGFAIWLAVEKNRTPSLEGFTDAVASVPGGGQGGGAQPVALAQPAQLTPYTPTTGRAGQGLRPVALNTGGNQALQLQASFNRAADIIRPSVVNINAIRSAGWRPAPAAGNAPQFIDPFDGIPDKVFGQQAFESVGSGLIVDPSGYVVTNDHLVSGATSIMVSLYKQNAEHLSARLVATDPGSDLALLKLEGNGPYPAARLADSSRVEVGDWVLAVGNPFGLGHTVTSGIISGRRDQLTISGVTYRGLLQTDAPINQGSSGGPLVNLQGQVVGINTAIYAPTGVFNGTGFAIPSNRVGGFVSRLIGPRTRPVAQVQPMAPQAAAPMVRPGSRLGVGVVPVTPGLAAKLSMPGVAGVFISSVTPDSPAEDAGLSRGDVITHLAGRPVTSSADLQAVAAGLPPLSRVTVTVWRKGQLRNMTLKTRPALGFG
jgi:serine protease Do